MKKNITKLIVLLFVCMFSGTAWAGDINSVQDLKEAIGYKLFVNSSTREWMFAMDDNRFLVQTSSGYCVPISATLNKIAEGQYQIDYQYNSSVTISYVFYFEGGALVKIEALDDTFYTSKGIFDEIHNLGVFNENGCTKHYRHCVYVGNGYFNQYEFDELVKPFFLKVSNGDDYEVGKVYHYESDYQENPETGRPEEVFYISEACGIAKYILDYSVNVSSVGWASLYFDISLTIPSGVNVYYASNIEGTTVSLTEITGAIPANTGVIFKAAAGDVTFPISYTATPVTGNLFAGVTKETANPGNVYVLSPESTAGTPIFQNYTGAALGAYKAYLPAAGAGDVLNFVFDDASSISNIDTAVPSKVRYNLNGQAVGANYKGIVIVNGKKYINK